MMAYVTLGQFAQSLIPALSRFRSQGQADQVRGWLGRFVRYSWLGAWLAVIVVWLAADWGIPCRFGEEFGGAADPVRWLSLAIPLAALLWAGNAVATAVGRGRVKFGASLVGVVLFVAVAVWLVPVMGAIGAAAALGMSVGMSVVILALFLRPDLTLNWPLLLSTGLAGVAIIAGIWSLG
jgi:O-antigen/teichoic acid export membrane protein